VGAVIEGHRQSRVTAGLEPLPGAIALSIADQQEQGRAGPVGGTGAAGLGLAAIGILLAAA